MADVLKLAPNQLAIAAPTFVDDEIPPQPVDVTGFPVTLDSSDSAIVAWEKRNDAGEADANGKDAIVAQGVVGKATVHYTVTNPDSTQAMLTGEVEVVAEGAFAGSMNFGTVIAKK